MTLVLLRVVQCSFCAVLLGVALVLQGCDDAVTTTSPPSESTTPTPYSSTNNSVGIQASNDEGAGGFLLRLENPADRLTDVEKVCSDGPECSTWLKIVADIYFDLPDPPSGSESCTCWSCGAGTECTDCDVCSYDPACISGEKTSGCYGESSSGSNAGSCECSTKKWDAQTQLEFSDPGRVGDAVIMHFKAMAPLSTSYKLLDDPNGQEYEDTNSSMMYIPVGTEKHQLQGPVKIGFLGHCR